MSLMKSVWVLLCMATLSVVIPQGRVFAQAGGTQQQQQQQQEELLRQRQQEELLRQRQQEELLRQRQQEDLFRQRQEQRQREPQQRPNISWPLLIVHAHTFEKIYGGIFTARNVTSPEEAKWDIRGQLGFPLNSDQRTAGGVPQLIIWGEVTQGEITQIQLEPSIVFTHTEITAQVIDEATPRRRPGLILGVLGGILGIGVILLMVAAG